MTKDVGNLQPLNGEKFFEEFNSLEEDARQEKLQEIVKNYNDTLDSNRTLFARTKKAEGFEQDKEGNWLKIIEKKPEEKKPEAKEPVKPDEELLKKLDTMALKIAGITADDEVELYNKWKTDTGRDADSVVGNKIFQAELADLRTAKANTAATSNVEGEGTASGAKSDPDYWMAKATKGDDGNLRFPEETPKELFSKIVEKLGTGEPGASKGKLEFYNSK